MEDKNFEQEKSGLMTKIIQDSSSDFYPEDDISFQPIKKKALSGTNITWETILDTISIHEKRILGNCPSTIKIG